jgi:branched-chain amino acid transport system substrate-binding protein
MADLIGRTLGQYQIIEQIGEGGMATVYKAYQPGLNRYVAVKVLPPLHAKQPGFSERFQREAEAIANLNHPNILPVYDSGQEEEYSFIVMRYVEGARTLKEVMQTPLSLSQVADLIGQIASALDYAHRQGVVHRDVKPANVLMDGDWVLLSDFGLAKMTEASVALTGTGVGIGTPAYMSPEQGQGLLVDHRTDIYSLGIILFEMLTGRIPHSAETPVAIIFKRATEPLPLPRQLNPNIPESVEQVILKALAREPGDRFARAGELAAVLKEAVRGVDTVEAPAPVAEEWATAPVPDTPPSTVSGLARTVPPWKWIAGIGGVAIIVAGLILALGGKGGPTPTPTTTPAAVGGVPTATRTTALATTPTLMPPTRTPLPLLPTDTSVPELTNTSIPEPTNTPVPPTHTPVPTATPRKSYQIVKVEEFTCEDAIGCVDIPPGDPIRIGYALVISGPNETLGVDSRRGIEIAIDDKLEVLGHEVELVGEDSQCSAEGGQTALTKLVSDPSLIAIIGTNCSSAGEPASKIASDAGLVLISPSTTAPSLTDPAATWNPGYLRTAHNDNVQGAAMAEFVYDELGLRKAATIRDGSPYADQLQQVFADTFERLGGKITTQEAVNVGDTDMRPVLTKIAATAPEFLYYPIFIAEGAFITVQAKEVSGMEGVLLAGADGMISPAFVAAAGGAAEGMYFSGPNLAFENPIGQAFLQKHRQKYGEEPLNAFHAHAYDATNMIFAAIEQVAVEDADGVLHIGRQALRDALYATKNLEGITGSLTCNEYGECADPQIVVIQLQNGEYMPIWLGPSATTYEPSNDWTKHPSNPVLGVGDPGSWDESWVIMPSVIKEGNTYMMWYRGVAADGLRRIGLATSTDGVTWAKAPANPVLDPGISGDWDENGIVSARVIKDGATFKMWYTGADTAGTMRIGYATSGDGTSWTKHSGNPVLDVGGSGAWDEQAVLGAHVVKDDATFKMWYTGTDAAGTLHIGYATSADGITWVKYISNPVLFPGAAGAWDDYGVSFPSVLTDGATYRMWYFGKSDPSIDHIGYATSSDGVSWLKYSGNPILDAGAGSDWDAFGVACPSVILDGDTFKMWFQGWQSADSASIRIGYASSGLQR